MSLLVLLGFGVFCGMRAFQKTLTTIKEEGDTLPDNHVLSWNILRLPAYHLAINGGRVQWCGYLHDYIGRGQLVAEVRLDRDNILHLRGPDFRDRGYNLQRQLHVGSRSVSEVFFDTYHFISEKHDSLTASARTLRPAE